jgi:CBS domain-containing protein
MAGILPTDPISTLTSMAVASIAPSGTLQAAAEAMTSEELGLLVVTTGKDDGSVSVLSERDIVAAVAEGLDLSTERVVDHCRSEVVAVEETVSINDAARTMAEAQIRHLAVSRGGYVVGIVSIRDIIVVLAD